MVEGFSEGSLLLLLHSAWTETCKDSFGASLWEYGLPGRNQRVNGRSTE